MTYFYIRNRGTMHRRLMEVVGPSTKRGLPASAGKIGHKGSGKKLAAIAALRADIQTIVASSDENGPYLLDFDTKLMRLGELIAQRVCMRYRSPGCTGEAAHEERFDTSWSLDAFAEWDRNVGDDAMALYKILREHAHDAWDEDQAFTWGTCESPEYAAEGETVTYLTYRPEFEQMMAAPERYFKFLTREVPLAAFASIGAIWKKSEPGVTRAFLQGELAACTRHHWSSAFDYDVIREDLQNEDRTLHSQMRFAGQVGAMLALLEDVGLCAAILSAIDAGEAVLEMQALDFATPLLSAEAKAAWLKAARAVFGAETVLDSADEYDNSVAVGAYGRKLLRPTSPQLRTFLKAVGLAEAAELTPRPSDQSFEPLRFASFSESSQARFRQAYALFAMLVPERAGKYPAYFFLALSPHMRNMRGFAGIGKGRFRQMWIQATSRTELPSVTEILEVLIHESRHCATKLRDNDLRFALKTEQDLMDLAHRLILALAGQWVTPQVEPIIGNAAEPGLVMPEFGITPVPDDVPKGGLFGK